MDGEGAGAVLLFYKYVHIDDPEEHAGWQRELCQRLGLMGKLRVATEGINGTLVRPPPRYFVVVIYLHYLS